MRDELAPAEPVAVPPDRPVAGPGAWVAATPPRPAASATGMAAPAWSPGGALALTPKAGKVPGRLLGKVLVRVLDLTGVAGREGRCRGDRRGMAAVGHTATVGKGGGVRGGGGAWWT